MIIIQGVNDCLKPRSCGASLVERFAAWAAADVLSDQEDPARLWWSAAAAAAWSCALIVAAAVHFSRESTRSILAAAAETAQQRELPRSVIVAGNTPYSARFYGAEVLVDHAPETAASTLARLEGATAPRLVVLRARDRHVLPEVLRSRVVELKPHDRWLLLVIPAAADVQLSTPPRLPS